MKLSMIGLIVLLALVAAFAGQTPGIIPVRFLPLTGATSLLVVIVAGFGAGVLGGWVAGLPGVFRRRSAAAPRRRAVPGAPGGGAGLRARGLIEHWELQPAVRLTPGGLEIVLRFSEEGNA